MEENQGPAIRINPKILHTLNVVLGEYEIKISIYRGSNPGLTDQG